MNKSISDQQAKYVPQPLIFAILLVLLAGMFIPQPLIIVRYAGVLIYIVFFSYLLGKRYFYYLHNDISWLLGFLILFGYLSVLGSICFYANMPIHLTIFFLTIASPLLLAGMRGLRIESLFQNRSAGSAFDLKSTFLFVSYIVCIACIIYILIHSQTYGGGVSPWPHLNNLVFLLYLASMCALFSLLIRKKISGWLLYVPVFFTALAVVSIVFPLGYGFDPFIHHATERLLLTSGTIQPKPFYYVGYYIIVAWFQLTAGIPYHVTNIFLAILSASILIPLSIIACYRYFINEKKFWLFLPFVFLLFPYGQLVQSSPQGLAYVWLISTILISVVYIETRLLPWWTLLAGALATLSFHPLAGIPLLVFVIALYFYKKNLVKPFSPLLIFVFAAMTVAVIPIAFLVISFLSPELSVSIHAPSLSHFFDPFIGGVYRYIRLDDLIYSIINNFKLLAIALGIYGFFMFDADRRKKFIPYFFGFIILYVDYLILRNFFDFNLATNEENSIFSLRLITIGLYIMLPLILFGAYHLLRRVCESRFLILFSCMIILACCATIAWYASYPRFDTKEHSKGYSASSADYAAVRWIHDLAYADPYLVLANQTVSAVAVKEYGFIHYYSGLFYYPLPTNGVLYQYFLNMSDVNINTDKILSDLYNLTGVKKYSSL